MASVQKLPYSISICAYINIRVEGIGQRKKVCRSLKKSGGSKKEHHVVRTKTEFRAEMKTGVHGWAENSLFLFSRFVVGFAV